LSASYTIRQFESLYTHLLNLRFRKEAEVLFLKKHLSKIRTLYIIYHSVPNCNRNGKISYSFLSRKFDT
jgi:hypothetical protein